MRQRVLATPVSSSWRHVRFTLACLILLAAVFASQPLHAEPDDTSTPSLTWPLLPGENLNQLARLFYPDHPAMRPVFVAQSIALSRELHPDISAESSYSQITSIVIPDIKALSQNPAASKRSHKQFTMVRQLSEASVAIVTEAMWREYDALVASNERLKHELEKLHAKLDQLQAIMGKLTEAARNFLSRQSAPVEKDANVLETQQNPIAATGMQATSQQSHRAQANHKQTNAASRKPMLLQDHLSTVLLLLLGLSVAAYLILRRRPKNLLDSLNDAPIRPLAWHTLQEPINPQEVEATPAPYVELIQVEDLGTSSEALAQARIMAGTGRSKAAIALLKASVDTHADVTLDAWLYLLELYREMGLKSEFIEYAQRLHSGFNVMAPQWEVKEIPLVTANTLEEFPHLVAQLVEHWKAGTAAEFLDTLVKDNRDGERAGFSLPVLQEILLLQAVLKNRE